jgi:hypothetical protein
VKKQGKTLFQFGATSCWWCSLFVFSGTELGIFGMASLFLFVFFVLSHLLLLHSAQEEVEHTKNCPLLRCGDLRPLGFPFANKTNPECGVFTIECRDDGSLTIQLEEGRRPYHVLGISQDNTIRIKDEWLGEQHPASVECESLNNLTITSSSFVSFEFSPYQTFFKCNRTLNISPPTNFKNISCNEHDIYYNGSSDSFPTSLSGCSIIQLPKNPNQDRVAVDGHPFGLLAVEFNLKPNVSDACYQCYRRGGRCKPGDKGELDCLGAEKGINIGITQQYLGIHIYLHENAYKFLFPFTLYLFLTHVLLLFLFHAIIPSYKAIALLIWMSVKFRS